MIEKQNDNIDNISKRKQYWNREYERNILRGNFKINRNLIVKVRQNIETNKDIKTVLDIGCGVGFFVKDCLQHKYKAKGIDLSESSIRWAKNAYGDNFIVSDISTMKLKKESVDCITCLETLQYIKDNPIDIIDKLIKTAKYKIIISVPNGNIAKDNNYWIFEAKDFTDLGFKTTYFNNNKRILAIFDKQIETIETEVTEKDV